MMKVSASVTRALTLAWIAFMTNCSSLPVPPVNPSSAPGTRTCSSAPTYSPRRTLFGVNLSTVNMGFKAAVQQNLKTFGHLPVVRIYDSHGAPSQMWNGQDAALPKGTAVVPSFALPPQEVLSGRDDAQIRAFFRAAPTDRLVFWNYYLEPESAVAARKFTTAQYRAAFRHISTIAASVCKANLYPTLVLMGWTASPMSRMSWQDYYPGARYVSVLAWDPYNSVNSTPTRYAPPSDLYNAVVNASRGAGKPWAIAETGSGLVPGDNGTGRTRWLRSVGAYADRTNAAFVTYFNSKDAVDFRLLDAPSRNEWRALMAP